MRCRSYVAQLGLAVVSGAEVRPGVPADAMARLVTPLGSEDMRMGMYLPVDATRCVFYTSGSRAERSRRFAAS